MFDFHHLGSFDNLESWLKSMRNLDIYRAVKPYAQHGANALSSATPIDSGRAASAWDYHIFVNRKSTTIIWSNDNVENGFPVAIMLQYGYATGTGGYVQGRDYINPTMKPIFDAIADGVWKVVTSA
ncbi:MAG: HK97 gp10 family phage protein [Actinobacteria bacterium]|nr:HK97 gp10 family phage protein [Actinomycetota bacterium]